MDSERFDAIAKLLAGRRSRRAALRGGGLAVAAATVSVVGRPAARARPATGEEATPAGTPETAPTTDPHPGADAARPDPEYLFVQPFAGGTWAPKAGEESAFTLTLSGAPANTVYFSDRPDRVFGLAPTGPFLANLGFTPENPPNAALVARTVDGAEREILVIELLDPAYDAGTGTLTYDARVLADYAEHGLAHAAHRQTDDRLPETFAAGGLFIDGCSDIGIACFTESGHFVGGTQGRTCWDPNHDGGSCVVCHADEDCANAYPDDCRTPYRDANGTFVGFVLTCQPSP